MNKFIKSILFLALGLSGALMASAQAPANAPDIMLQGFYYDSYTDKGYGRTKWTDLSSQAAEIAETFSMVWLPPSAQSEGGTGYHPKKWSDQNSAWGYSTSLKNLIKSFHSNGESSNPTGHCYVIADIVINHKAGNSWLDLENEDFGTYGEFTLYEAGQSTYVCSDDEAASKDYKCLGAKDAGYETNCGASGGYCAARDLDHSNEYLRSSIKAYLQWMKNVMGYDGWRYDLVKGYLGKYTKEYNNAAGAYYSVGEYWDGSYDALKYWVNQTGNTSTAFDFCMKYNALNNNLAKNNYQGLAGYGTVVGLAGNDQMKRYATTFVENHDTFRDGSKYTGDWEQANAYIISAPGIPCVFYPHWVKCKAAIKKMAAARYACGITNQSAASTSGTCSSYYKCTTIGTKGKLICFIGSGWSAPSGYTLACSGNGWAYYTNVTVPTGPVVTMSPADGYVGPNGKVTLTATKGTIYYTTNGTTPSASSTKYTSQITITTNKTVVKAIAIDGTAKSEVVSGTFLTEKPAGLTVKFKAPSSWTTVSLYAWSDSDPDLLGEWPGKTITKSGEYYQYTITETDTRPLNIIFNDGNNGHQTTDLSASADACWDGSSYTGAEFTPPICGAEPEPAKYIIIRVKKEGAFASVSPNVYYWGNGSSATWPGVKMTSENSNWWRLAIETTTGLTNIIFNDGTDNKTEDIKSVKEDACYTVSLPNYSKVACSGVSSVDGVAEDVVEVYPNPTSDVLYVAGDVEFSNAQVASLAGQVVNLPVVGGAVNVSNLSDGMYIITLSNEDGASAQTKFFKK